MVIQSIIKRVFNRKKKTTQGRGGCCVGVLGKLLSSCQLRNKWLKVSSPCQGAVCHEVARDTDGSWRSFCPICKRPVEARMVVNRSRGRITPGRRAYVAIVWGTNPGDVLGAAVLAKSMRLVNVSYELVLLHTDTIPDAALELLTHAGWQKLVCVESIYGVKALYNHSDPRFKGVFTKIQAMGLVEYEKVLLVDIDTLMLQNMDSLFELPAPAAMVRGPQHGYLHGESIDGASFFGDVASGRRTWGQCGGINSGVMLLAPNEDEYNQMLLEVLDPRHPSHIKGNGPEQDYFSRFWAHCWTHISVEYNFQLHQLYYALNPIRFAEGERRHFLVQDSPSSNIYLIHYSGFLKPWSRVLDNEFAMRSGPDGDARFLDETLRSFNGYWLWVLQDPETLEAKGPQEGVALDGNGKLRRIIWKQSDQNNCDQESPSSYPWTLGEEVVIPEYLRCNAESVVSNGLDRWNETYRMLEIELGCANLAAKVQESYTTKVAPIPAENPAVGWKNCAGWWVDHPVKDRISVLAGNVPEPFVVFSKQCKVLFELRGAVANGAHALAINVDGSVGPLLNGDIATGAAVIPEGSFVLLALVNLTTKAAAEVLQAFTPNDDGGILIEPPPAECGIAVFAGQKGYHESYQTMAAADFALAGLPWNGLEKL